MNENKNKGVQSRLSQDMYDDLKDMCGDFQRSVSDMVRLSIGYTIENWKEEKGGSITVDVLGEQKEKFQRVCKVLGIEEQDYISFTLDSLGKVMKEKNGGVNEEE